MGRFEQLPRYLHHAIAKMLVPKFALNSSRNTLSWLLSLRFLHSNFTPAITHAIFQFCELTVHQDNAFYNGPDLMSVHTFVELVKHERIRQQVSRLALNVHLEFCETYACVEQQIQIISNILNTVRQNLKVLVIRISPGLSSVLMRRHFEETFKEIDVCFRRLRSVSLNNTAASLNMVKPLLLQNPQVKVLKIEKKNPVEDGITEPVGMQPVTDLQMLFGLDRLIFEYADNSMDRRLLRTLPIRPRQVCLQLSADNRDSVRNLIEDICNLEIFSGTEELRVTFNGLNRQGVDKFCQILTEYGHGGKWSVAGEKDAIVWIRNTTGQAYAHHCYAE